MTHFSGLLDGFTVSADGTRVAILYRNTYYVLNLITHQLVTVPLELSA